jgi:hypothetical protein
MVVKPYPSSENGKRSLKRNIGFPNLEENIIINLLKNLKKYYNQPRYRKRFFKKHKTKNTKALNDEPQSVQNKDKPKYCPQKKKDCKCWICQEVGHYSYECPNTKNNKAQVRVLEEIMDLEHLAPIEDMLSDISSDEELYLLESDTDGDFELSDDDCSTTSDSEDQE